MQSESSDAVRNQTLEVVDRFNGALNRHDVDAVMQLMTADCIFESTGPAPNGGRYEGQDAVRDVWIDLFQGSPSARFESEETFAAGDRCVVRWRYIFEGGHIRGVDVIRVAQGKIAEKLAYVKG